MMIMFVVLSGLGVAFVYTCICAMLQVVSDAEAETQAAVFNVKNRISSYHGKIKKVHRCSCVGSFPGKYGRGWNGVTAEQHGMSVGCVFLDKPEDGLGQHAEDPSNPGKCYCATIYGERDYKKFGYLIEIKEDDTHEDMQKKKQLATAIGAYLWDRCSGVTKKEAEENAKDLWNSKGKVASWGCRWFVIWRNNIDEAVSYEQKIVVYYFKGQVGTGKVAWEDLRQPTVDPWDGIGLGGSQKCEVAYLDWMKEHDPRYDYKEVDVEELITSFGSEMKETSETQGLVAEKQAVYTVRWAVITTLACFLTVGCYAFAFTATAFLPSLVWLSSLVNAVDSLSNPACALSMSGMLGPRIREGIEVDLPVGSRLTVDLQVVGRLAKTHELAKQCVQEQKHIGSGADSDLAWYLHFGLGF